MRNFFKTFILFFALIFFFVLFMLVSAYIPQEKIKRNFTESADFLCEKYVFSYGIEGIDATLIDRFADSITMNIAWNLGNGEPLKSVMLDEFYSTTKQNENKNFRCLIYGEEAEDAGMVQYMRYWHGSAAVVRILSLFLSIKGIYILNAVILIVFACVLIISFAKRKMYDCIIAFAAGLILTSSWYVPLSLEYTWVYFVFMAGMILTLIAHDKNREDLYSLILLACGMIICFLDFLTAETLTLTMPLILMIRLDKKSSGLRSIVERSAFWGIGYVGCWISKWIIAAAVLRENVTPYVSEHIAERLGGNTAGIPEMSLPVFVYSAIVRNILVLFPAGYGNGGIFAGIAILIFLAYIAYVYKKKEYDKRVAASYIIVALIPYIRYAVLHNHSYIHFFFTCRAQCAALTALVLAVLYVSDFPEKMQNRVVKKGKR